jgi:moderate conductance mechanosensitive channel
MTTTLSQWLLTKGLHIVLVVLFAVITTRAIRWIAGRISRRLSGADHEQTVRSEAVKHRQAVASVISSVAISLLYVMVVVDIANQLGLPLGSLVAPAAVLGGALGFGAQRIVQDLLSGFFIITEKQYGFGDLVELSVNGGGDARGTVVDVTLRVTKLRTGDGEVFERADRQIAEPVQGLGPRRGRHPGAHVGRHQSRQRGSTRSRADRHA